MNKHTANSMQFLGRVGNSSTKPSARGINLLGWETEEEPLSPEQQRDVLLRKIHGLTAQRKDSTNPAERKAIGTQILLLNLEVARLKGGPKACGPELDARLLDVIKEQTPRLTWNRWVEEARKRISQAEGEKPA